MIKWLALLVAVVGVVGGLAGAALTNYLASSRELTKHVLEFKQKAYSDFFRAQSLLDVRGKEDEANQLIRETKLRILLIAPRAVICALSTYWVKFHDSSAASRSMPTCDNPDEKKRDVAIYQRMRSEFFASLNLERPELDVAVLVPYLRTCVLSEADLDRACKGP
jgi:hypothetical protein